VEKKVNIGAGLILLPIGVLILIIGTFLMRKKRVIGTVIIIAGILIIVISVLLLTGIYDPYSNHIR
jgi:cytochrome c biogenesis protein CcdA